MLWVLNSQSSRFSDVQPQNNNLTPPTSSERTLAGAILGKSIAAYSRDSFVAVECWDWFQEEMLGQVYLPVILLFRSRQSSYSNLIVPLPTYQRPFCKFCL